MRGGGSLLRSVIGRVVDLRSDDELRAMLWATAYGFSIMFAYYILRPVRDEISSADRGNLQLLWTAVFFVMLVAVPLYSWVATRFSRRVFVPLANRFFIACLFGFWASLQVLPLEARPWIDRAFYVWTSVFALFVVTVFWGFVADCFRNEQAKRLFGFIAVGSSIGAMAGSSVTAVLAETVPRFSLLLVACVPLEAASWCALVLHRRYGDAGAPPGEKERPLAGDALSGIRVVFGSPYLMGIAGFILLMTFASTILYFQQAHLVGEAIADRGARTTLYAQMDFAANGLTLLLQVWLAAKIIRWLGVGVALALTPALVVAGFVAIWAVPVLGVLVVVQVGYRALRYGLAKPAREVLFTVVSREEKYKSKAFLDAAVYRGGDLASGWIYAGLAAIGLTVGTIGLVAAPLAVAWTVIGLRLGRSEEARAAQQRLLQAAHDGGAAPAAASPVSTS